MNPTSAAYLIIYNGQMHALDPKHPETKNAAAATEMIWNEAMRFFNV